MLLWATEYWYICLGAVILGLAIAAWIWLQADRSADIPGLEIDERPPATPLEPVRPVIDVAERIDFAEMPRAAPAPVSEPVPNIAPADGAMPDASRPNVPAAIGDPDDLTQIKGLGPKLKTLLATLGVVRFDQIAAWTDADIAEVDRFLGTFQGRIARDNWVEQAGYLARGDTDGFAARFGALG